MSTKKTKDAHEQGTPTFKLSDLRYSRSKNQERAAAQIIRNVTNYSFVSKNSRDWRISVLEEMMCACRLIPYGEKTEEHKLIDFANRHFIYLIHLLENEVNEENIPCDSYEDIRNYLISIKESCSKKQYSEAVTWRINCFLSELNKIDESENKD